MKSSETIHSSVTAMLILIFCMLVFAFMILIIVCIAWDGTKLAESA